MKNFIDTISNIWKIEELRNRILITLGLLLVYRFGCQIVLPGIDSTQLGGLTDGTDQGIFGLLNAFTGGAFANASVFALGIMPYISASIVVQLMGIAIPYLQKLQKEGESGRKTINQITRWLTIGICIVQAPAYLYGLEAFGVRDSAFLLGKGLDFMVPAVIILVTGTVFAMWLGEKITDKGIGNGISLLIMIGIIATMPQSFVQEFISRTTNNNGGLMFILIEVIIWFLVILACILLVMATRQIPVQYARRTASGGYEKNIMGSRQYIPLKLNASGVMPIIFAQAIMFVPGMIGGAFDDTSFGQWMQVQFSDIFGWAYNLLFAILIIIFTYFYTAITVPTNKMADDLKRSGGFIPGIRPGKETGDYLDKIMSLITLPGSIFLALLAILPAVVVKLMDVQAGWALFYGGTSLLIMVGVAIDTVQQVNSYLLNRHYDGLMKTGKNRKVA
ncbi:MAG: preprotein translocase subunit SecY [Maribacter dokdonensis]|uniref:Protein translocase subunit SecY n=4 Tax=Maribacter TaxID=252356 RepID=A0ABY0UQW6_9FLAO|nr:MULTISPECIES: preprotein translocase subunit SecY [Maribacter]KSA14919.1 Preprotein translocase secY subunit [Maribacter dokdonensis DSW-8]MBU2900034.1 preprotein translocase subunit SecY [Maribacter dokdonensis]MDP2525473.1 preprotein translocase subunit SecY [Maribacter dokdonensis]PHN94284.1 preprotein translocase subunit SecY [Maribacter sp. 6B07]SDT04903.1 preprotein translocase subunit SecY [Maribacter dokdonensis]|tara:strand:+ start:1319 stop:2662 length:1344 start_codon:yes stop_codon:yes gene_type:complete